MDVYVGPGAVYTGAARVSQEAHDKAEAVVQQDAAAGAGASWTRSIAACRRRVAALQAKLTSVAAELQFADKVEKQRGEAARRSEAQLARARRAD